MFESVKVERDEYINIFNRVSAKCTGEELPERMVIDEYRYSFFLSGEIWYSLNDENCPNYKFLHALTLRVNDLYMYVSKTWGKNITPDNPLTRFDNDEKIDVPMVKFCKNTPPIHEQKLLLDPLGIDNIQINELAIVDKNIDIIIFSTRRFYETCVCYFRNKKLFDYAVNEMSNWILDLYKDFNSERFSEWCKEFAETHWDEFPFFPDHEKQEFLKKIRSGTGRIRNPRYD